MKLLLRNNLLENLKCSLRLERRLWEDNQPAAIHTSEKRARVLTTSWPDSYTRANEKLSTFCTAATGFPPTVMFVNGVLCSVALPYQSIASTAACPPSQLQLEAE
jgi:hypothetical protein